MYGIAIAQVRANARRLTSTGLAVVVGVAFLAGTLILGNTLNANFERLFTDVSAGTDVVVRNATAVDPTSVNEQRGPIPASTVDAVARVPGVAVASAQIEGYGALVGANGEPIGGNGPPRQAASWITEPSLNPYRLVEGRAPVGPDEVVVNRGAATAGHLHLGDTTTVRTPDPVTVTIVGIATFGDEDGFGQTTFTAFTLAGAERHIFQRSDEISSVVVKAAPGDSAESLRDRIAATLPPGTEAITGSQLAAERIDNVSKQFLDGLRTGLTGFALIALLVASITISNTFSITLAQRSRELALVRAVGASRRQVRRSVALEAFVVGCACAAVGVAAGFGLAGLLKGLFDAAGFALPAGGLTVSVASLVVPFVAGVAVTVIAALVPARRAVRVSPVAALSDAEDTVDTISYRRIAIGTVGMGLGVVAAAVAEASGTAALFALGAVALIAGAVLIAPVAVVPATTALGRVLRVTRRQTAATELAIGNARHRARRTAATATALLVGATVVTIVTVFITSVQTSIGNRVQSA
ncbi:MAG TPA: ABC transporter permease, partial [Acidimicrobiales bacterium]